ncbi:MAG: extracellular solute-binding protein [Clostridiales bacterium]|nr:extracellular solute-binding protein [Clostridiales bacterium]
MLKRIFQIILAIGLITVFLISSTGCGDKNEDAKKRTLTISVPADSSHTQLTLQAFKNKFPDVELVFNNYDLDYAKYNQQISTQLLGGGAPDLFMPTSDFSPKLFDSGLLADFYPLMQSDPDFNEDDYYMNVIKSGEYCGKLFWFPSYFGHRPIAVNNLFSKSLAERYKSFDAINLRQLLDLYNSLPDKGGRYLCDPTAAISDWYTFIDFANKTCDFNNDYFIKYITDQKNITDPKKEISDHISKGKDFFNQWDISDFSDSNLQERYALEYIFKVNSGDTSYLSLLLPYANERAFTHFIPLADDKGSLITGLGDSFCISAASANKDLAWEFIKLFTNPDKEEFIQTLPTFFHPIRRDLFKATTTRILENTIEEKRKVEAIDGETSQIVEGIMAFLERCNDMPMVSPIRMVEIDRIIEETLTDFLMDLLTAEQAASILQNKISLYLTE